MTIEELSKNVRKVITSEEEIRTPISKDNSRHLLEDRYVKHMVVS